MNLFRSIRRPLGQKPGLSLKVLFIVLGVCFVGILASTILVVSLQRDQLVDAALAANTRLSIAVESSLEQAMFSNDKSTVNEIIRTMVAHGSADDIRILDTRGIVHVSSKAQEVGTQLDPSEPRCQVCHKNGLPPTSSPVATVTSRVGHEALFSVNLIQNHPQCQSCHNPQQKVLGVLMIQMPLDDLNNELTASMARMGFSALATLVLLVGLLTLALRRIIVRPIQELTRGMSEVRAGNLNYPVETSSQDELGDLAKAFDAMRDKVQASQTYSALLLDETRHREQEAVTLYRLMTKVSASLEISQVLDAIATGAREVLDADIGVVALVDEGQTTIQVGACTGCRTSLLKGLVVPLRDRDVGKQVQPICTEQWTPDLPIPHVSELIAEEGIVSSLAAPMWCSGRLRGFVAVMTRQRRQFTETEVQLFTRLVLQVVIAIENADLYKQVRYLATLEERDRLAREMHDNLAQTLGYMNVKISITNELLSKNEVTPARSSLLELKQITKEAYTDVRESIFGLRTSGAPRWGYAAMLREYVAEFRTHYGIDARLSIEDDRLVDFPQEVQVQIQRIIQEALANIRKHSGAGQAWVRFEREDHCVRISIEDNGRGFDPVSLSSDGARRFGLEIMRERAESVAGELKIESVPNIGTKIIIQVPSFAAD